MRAAVLAVSVAAVCAWTVAQQSPRVRNEMTEAPVQLSSSTRIAPANERGEPLVIDGTVLGADGKPAAGVTVYAYHTDATGHYRNDNMEGNDPAFRPRLRGWAKTDSQGHFQWVTIRPAPYPNRNVPAHIHVTAWGAGYPVQWSEVQFAGDPLLGQQHFTDNTADYLHIIPLERKGNGWHGKLELRMSRDTNFR